MNSAGVAGTADMQPLSEFQRQSKGYFGIHGSFERISYRVDCGGGSVILKEMLSPVLPL